MLVSYISLLIVCGITSAALPGGTNTPEERARILGPLAYVDSRMDFQCAGLGPSPTVPTSVHQLKPGDIHVVGAIGDSLTAASGAKAATIIGMLTQNRGVSWSIGGEKDLSSVVTLPNILRKFYPELQGFSTGNGNENSRAANFNVAKPGAVSDVMPAQANLLIDRMKSALGEERFASEWKLVTVFFGANDQCEYCKDINYYSPTNYLNNVKQTLDILHANMPRTLVNFVTVLNVAGLQDLHEGLMCQFMQGFLCDCAINPDTREQVRAAALQYQAATKELIESGIYDTRDDFTVVLQPFMEKMTVPITPDGYSDFSYFTPDCFHLSQKGHEAAAIEYWNNLMEKVGQKSTLWNLVDTAKCPSDDPNGYIYTSKNSN